MTDQEVKDAIDKRWEEIAYIPVGKEGLFKAFKILLEEQDDLVDVPYPDCTCAEQQEAGDPEDHSGTCEWANFMREREE